MGADRSSAFWNRVAQRYADMPMRNAVAYEATLNLVRQYLHADQCVLEIGCGTGTTAVRLAGYVRRYVATDYAPEMIAIAEEKRRAEGLDHLELSVGTPGDGSLPEGSFDAILAFNVLHLLPDRTAALSEVFDMLPSGGVLISKTPCFGGVFRILQPLVAVMKWLGKAPDVRFLTSARLERDVVSAGFEIVEVGNYPKRPPSRLIVAKRL